LLLPKYLGIIKGKQGIIGGVIKQNIKEKTVLFIVKVNIFRLLKRGKANDSYSVLVWVTCRNSIFMFV
jgi:hypothetical protein